MQTASVRRPALVSMSKVAQVYGFSRSTGYRLAEQGIIRTVKVGNRTFIDDSTVKFDELHRLTPPEK